MRIRQQGLTLIGLVFGGFILIFAAVLVMKLLPPYLEFFSVKKALLGIDQQTRGRVTTAAEVRRRELA